ncbi:hypothetical protein [Methylobacterium sp. Leaf465]|uniref:hypothetical protein n=1 Tax=Methylobacterium sp. Leaf465 TaxID=1736385 RepID=UPI000B03B428|nr:hypothetical protein [Methylobacterium sp. Leaf465]
MLVLTRVSPTFGFPRRDGDDTGELGIGSSRHPHSCFASIDQGLQSRHGDVATMGRAGRAGPDPSPDESDETLEPDKISNPIRPWNPIETMERAGTMRALKPDRRRNRSQPDPISAP